MVNQFLRFMKEEEGATAIEYALLASLIAGVLVGTVTILGGNVNTSFTNVSAALS